MKYLTTAVNQTDSNEIINELWYDEWYGKVCTDADLHNTYECVKEANALDCTFDEWLDGETTIFSLAEGIKEIINRILNSEEEEEIVYNFDDLYSIGCQLEENFGISKKYFLEFQVKALRNLTKRV